ncbi:zinc-dependent metalloprotease family protein [Aquimarina spongiae]|uniref:Reprolysin family propeptide n=1 Tax=Aquimarina spongiae TaxID=570521 RepID=A0A1M6J0H5_9FLAO|nr:zinc-dependent metalloprotease family protein [Aquimarina spongiae]SHJ40112.1 Reprolysin family propeptide [Aquimarina spongiae]
MKNKKTIITSLRILTIGVIFSIFMGCQQDELLEEDSILQTEEGVSVQQEFEGKLISNDELMKDGNTTAIQRINKKFNTYEVYAFDFSALSDYVNSKQQSVFVLKLNSNKWEITLEPTNLISPKYRSIIHTQNGIMEGGKAKNVYYKGFTSDGGSVRLNLDQNKLNGFIETKSGEFFIENLSNLTGKMSQNKLLVYQKADLNTKAFEDDVCGGAKSIAEDMENYVDDMVNTKNSSIVNGVLEISTFALFDRYKNSDSNVNKTNSKILELLNLSQKNYDQFGIEFNVVEQQVSTCSSCDPFSFSTSMEPSKLLNSFRLWARSGFQENHDIGLLFTHNNIKRGNIFNRRTTFGVAYINGICSSSSKYAWISQRWTKDKTREVLSHEIGHLFGSGHQKGRNIMRSSPLVIPSKDWTKKTKDYIRNNSCY